MATGAGAETLRTIQVMDQRGELMGWEAIGRLDTKEGFCTGTLIARDIVLTAAHCVYHPLTTLPLKPEEMVFRAGYHRGQQIAIRKVTRIVVPRQYQPDPNRRATATSIPYDLALLKLEWDIVSAEADPFKIHEVPISGTAVSLVSYGRGRSEVLTRENNCALTERFGGGILAFNCQATFGSSGAPVFVREDGRTRILSVISGISQQDEGLVAYGMVLPRVVQGLVRQVRNESSRALVTRGVKRVAPGERSKTGARFIRPETP